MSVESQQTSIPVSTDTRDRVQSLKRRMAAEDDENINWDDFLNRLVDSHERVASLTDLYDW